MPKVSVVIPCYNLGRYLDETVASVLAQTYSDYEIIVVNDGSSDELTNQLLENFQRPQTRVIHTPNQGVASARNTGIAAAAGGYILPLDADDLIGPSYLQQAVTVLDQNREFGIVTCLIEFFGAVDYQPPQPQFSLEQLLVRNVVGPCASLFRKADWERAGGYNTNMTGGWEDWDFWLSLLELGVEVYRLPEVLYQYRIRPESRERSISPDQRVELYLQLYANHPALYHRHMRGVFTEICAYHELQSLRSYRLATLLTDPAELFRSIVRQLKSIVRS